MKIYNADKTEIIDKPDLSKGELKDDVLIIHHDAVDEQEKVEEQGHYEIIKEYPNGGKDVKWVVDVPGKEYVEAKEAYDEEIKIQVYIPYTEDKLLLIEKSKEITFRKADLSATDFKAIKYFEGYYTDDEYEPIKKKRQELRDKINKIQKEIDELMKKEDKR